MSSYHERLRLVDDPGQLLEIICSLSNREFTLKDFVSAWLSATENKEINPKTAEAYFSYAKILNLVETTSEGREYTYRVKLDGGSALCSSLKRTGRSENYRRVLRILIMTSKVSTLFEEFLTFVDHGASRTQVYDEFREVTGKALIQWCSEAGFIRAGPQIVALVKKPKQLSQETVWNELRETFRKMQETEVVGMRRTYVRIGEIRRRVMLSLDIERQEQFDQVLKGLLDSKTGKNIELYGAPTQFLGDPSGTFRYQGKVYALISIKSE